MTPSALAARIARSVRAGSGLPGEAGDDRRLYARAWWAILVCVARLRFPRLFRTRRWLRAELGEGPAIGEPGPRAMPAGTRVITLFRLAAGNHVVGVPCLPRALALRRLLRAHGIPTRLRVGMRKRAGVLEGHAWLDTGGAVVGDDEGFVGTFVPFEWAG